jgi:hypothetical protein
MPKSGSISSSWPLFYRSDRRSTIDIQPLPVNLNTTMSQSAHASNLRNSGDSVIMDFMEIRITATELARKLGDVLGRVRFRRDVFVIERNGEAVARLSPVPTSQTATLGEALRAWREAGGSNDPTFADDLERVSRADRAPKNPWA